MAYPKKLYAELTDDESEHIVEDVMFYRNQAMARYSGMRGAQTDMMALVENRWPSVFSTEMDPSERQIIANTFRVHIEDLGSLFAEQPPMERVFPASPSDMDGSEKRERVVSYITGSSHEWNRLTLRGMDIVAGGYTAIKVWPDLAEEPAKRFPRFRRLHPLSVWPETNWKPDEPSDNVVAEYVDTWERLSREFPQQSAKVLEALQVQLKPREHNYEIRSMAEAEQQVPSVSMIDYYSVGCIARVAVCSKPSSGEIAMLLAYRENDTGLCPVQIAYRPTWASVPTGLLDDAKGPMQAKNQAWNLIMGYFIDMLYGGKLAWNVANPGERGPGTVYRALGPDAKMEPITAQSPAMGAFQVLTSIDAEGRESAVAPRSRQGDVELNKATAAFLGKAQGQMSSVVKGAQSAYAQTKEIANVVALEQDKRWCNAEGKKIHGFARGKRFEDTYTPADTIGDDTANLVSFGPGSGLDKPTHMVMLGNKKALGTISTESYLEQDPDTTDVSMELARIFHEGVQGSVISSALPNMPPEIQLEGLLMARQGQPEDKILEFMVNAQKQASAQAATLAQGLAPPGGSPVGAAPAGGPPGVPGAEQGAVLPPREMLRPTAAGR